MIAAVMAFSRRVPLHGGLLISAVRPSVSASAQLFTNWEIVLPSEDPVLISVGRWHALMLGLASDILRAYRSRVRMAAWLRSLVSETAAAGILRIWAR